MGPDTVVKKALGWLAHRGKSVSKHISLHNSSQGVAGRTRPWVLRKAIHTVTKGGDRVTQKLVERTIKDADNYVLQANGRHAFSKVFGRQIGKEADQTALRVIVHESGKIITAFAITAAEATASVAAVLFISEALVETIESLERTTAAYNPQQNDPDSKFVEEVIDFFNDLGNDSLGKNEDFYCKLDGIIISNEQKLVSRLQESSNETFTPEHRLDVLSTFQEGLAGVAAPYIDDDA